MPLLEVSRDEWKAQPSKEELLLLQPPVGEVFITFTGTETCTDKIQCMEIVREIQYKHQDQGLPDISYSFLVGGDGRVYEGRGWTYCPCPPLKVEGCQGNSIVIAKIGPRSLNDPCKFMERAAGSILDSGVRQNFIDSTTKYYIHSSKDT